MVCSVTVKENHEWKCNPSMHLTLEQQTKRRPRKAGAGLHGRQGTGMDGEGCRDDGETNRRGACVDATFTDMVG